MHDHPVTDVLTSGMALASRTSSFVQPADPQNGLPAQLMRMVYVIEDDAHLREIIFEFLEKSGETVQTFSTAEEFLDVHSNTMRGCVVVDIQLPAMDGVRLLTTLNARASRLSTIAISGYAKTSVVVDAMRAGAVDFLEKPFAPGALLSAVHAAMKWASTGAASKRGDAVAAALRVAKLTPRERTVFNEFATGASTKEVADVLSLSPKTVETYRSRLLSKLDISTPYALVRLAVLDALFGSGQRNGKQNSEHRTPAINLSGYTLHVVRSFCAGKMLLADTGHAFTTDDGPIFFRGSLREFPSFSEF